MTAVWIALLAVAWAQDPVPSPAPPPVPAEQALAPLEAAYQKEFAYLSAERDGLERRIAAQAREADATRAKLSASVDQVEARLAALQVRIERAVDELTDLDRVAETAVEADDALTAALFQARNSLETDGTPPPAVEGDGLEAKAAGFAAVFAEGVARVRAGGEARVVPGSFFAPDGTKRDGELLLLGNVATFGAADGQTWPLLPAGEDRLQAHPEQPGATGAALLSGADAPVAGLFLHEGRTKRIEERAVKTLGDVLQAGGTVGYVILAIGLLALLLTAVRVVVLGLAARGASQVDDALRLADRGRWGEASARVAAAGGAAPRVVAELLEAVDRGSSNLEDVANAALLREQPRIERFGAAILVIAAVAPLLGLLGTVTGMIATFDIITEFGTGDPRMLSGGISEALVTTQFGLIVAIPALLAGNLLAGWGETVLGRAETAALRVLNVAGRSGDDREPEPVGQPHLASVGK